MPQVALWFVTFRRAERRRLLALPQVGHLKRGIYGWDMEKLPFVGTYDAVGAGRTPSVVEEEIFSYGREVTCAELQHASDPMHKLHLGCSSVLQLSPHLTSASALVESAPGGCNVWKCSIRHLC